VLLALGHKFNNNHKTNTNKVSTFSATVDNEALEKLLPQDCFQNAKLKIWLRLTTI